MQVNELQKLCNDSISEGIGFVHLVFPKPTARLCGKRGPRGTLICTNHAGASVVRFDAKAILRFIEKQGLAIQ